MKQKNTLETINPKLSKEWHATKNGNLKPSDVAPGSNKKAWWQCSKNRNHEWEAHIGSRNSGVGCPYCSNRLVLAGDNDLETINPQLAKEWHPTKNGDLKPSDVTPNSGRKVWWQCCKNSKHEWESSICNRGNNKRGCPICSNSQVLSGDNDLETLNPQLAREWHSTKNGDLKPSDVTPNSGRKVWWQCSNNFKHEWEASICNRNKGKGCHYCSGHKPFPGESDLETLNPQLAKEWHPSKNGDLKPSNVSPNSNQKAWWLCSKNINHEWEAMINNRSKGIGCPICSNKLVLPGDNDLETINPQLTIEWHPTKNGDLKPSDVTPNSGRKVWWKCPINPDHEWISAISDRSSGNGCPHCSFMINTSFAEQCIFYYLSEVFTSIKNRHMFNIKNTLLEVDIYIPEINISIEYDGFHWHKGRVAKDEEKNSFLKDITNLIRIREYGLKETFDSKNILLENARYPQNIQEAISKIIKLLISNQGLTKEQRDKLISLDVNINKDRIIILNSYVTHIKNNSIKVTHPQLAKEWHPSKNNDLKPEYFTSGSNHKVWWLCSNNPNHEWDAPISQRLNRGCPICSNRRILAGYNDLETLNPQLAKEWHPSNNGPLKPSGVAPKSGKKVWWLCSNNPNHEWEATIKNRTNGTTCPVCSGNKILPGDNDLATLNPQLSKEWHPTKNGALKPSEIAPNSNKKVWWQCNKNLNHEWQATINSRNHPATATGCPICSGHKVLPGDNDLETLNPQLAKEWHSTKNGLLKPSDVKLYSNKKVWWQCNKNPNHEWEEKINSRSSSGRGCPQCIKP